MSECKVGQVGFSIDKRGTLHSGEKAISMEYTKKFCASIKSPTESHIANPKVIGYLRTLNAPAIISRNQLRISKALIERSFDGCLAFRECCGVYSLSNVSLSKFLCGRRLGLSGVGVVFGLRRRERNPVGEASDRGVEERARGESSSRDPSIALFPIDGMISSGSGLVLCGDIYCCAFMRFSNKSSSYASSWSESLVLTTPQESSRGSEVLLDLILEGFIVKVVEISPSDDELLYSAKNSRWQITNRWMVDGWMGMECRENRKLKTTKLSGNQDSTKIMCLSIRDNEIQCDSLYLLLTSLLSRERFFCMPFLEDVTRIYFVNNSHQ